MHNPEHANQFRLNLFLATRTWLLVPPQYCIIRSMKYSAGFFLFFSIISNSVIADVTEYDFEIIIFEDTSGRYTNSEQWTHELINEDRSPDEAKRNPGTRLKNITPIKGIGLQRFANALDSRKRYNVLVHKAWRQKWIDNETAVDIPIDSHQSDTNTIHGSIRIVLERYLHIYTDMIYRQPRGNTGPVMYGQNSRYREYPIKSHRRMRSKELHYIDHPLVGMLIQINPVKASKEESSKE